jgi:hypothetical protein
MADALDMTPIIERLNDENKPKPEVFITFGEWRQMHVTGLFSS